MSVQIATIQQQPQQTDQQQQLGVAAVPTQQHIILQTIPQKWQRLLTYPGFKGRRARVLGAIQIVCALISIITNGVGLYAGNQIYYSYDGHDYFMNVYAIGFGFWCPIFFITSGALGIVTYEIKTHRKLHALLGTAVTSCIFSVTMVSFSCWALAWSANLDDYDDNDRYDQQYDEADRRTAIAMGVFQLLASIVECVTSVWLAKLAGDHISCGGGSPQAAQYATNTHQVVFSQQHQQLQVQPMTVLQSNMMAPGAMTSYLAGMSVVQGAVISQPAPVHPVAQAQMHQKSYPVQALPVAVASEPYPMAAGLGPPTAMWTPSQADGTTDLPRPYAAT